MTKEIGSEFHKISIESGMGIIVPASGTFVFSGRTAIETVLKNIPKARKALLPSYCCDSMIEPFRKANIDVEFYPVDYERGLNIEVEVKEDVDILLWCNYFGFRHPMPELSVFSKRGGVVIEDITHSFLSDQPFHTQSNYLIASIRKWEPVNCGGYCAKVGGNLHDKPIEEPPQMYIELKTSAMELKTSYLINPQPEMKKRFLTMFGESNRWLAEHYAGLSIDTWSKEFLSHVDVNKQREKRRNNAKALYEGLKGKAQFLFQYEDMDCPLFVPILLENRDEIRKHLIQNQIYCPVHWPKTEGCESNLYDMELSLICDQRYEVKDMNRIVSVLSEAL